MTTLTATHYPDLRRTAAALREGNFVLGYWAVSSESEKLAPDAQGSYTVLAPTAALNALKAGSSLDLVASLPNRRSPTWIVH
jgi:hypothetical protein